MQIPESAPAPRVCFAVALALIGALGPSAVDMYLASLPGIAEAYGASYARVQLTLTVFLLAMGPDSCSSGRWWIPWGGATGVAILLGAMQLIISSSATPLSGIMAPLGAAHWTLLLTLAALLVVALAYASTRNSSAQLNSLAGH